MCATTTSTPLLRISDAQSVISGCSISHRSPPRWPTSAARASAWSSANWARSSPSDGSAGRTSGSSTDSGLAQLVELAENGPALPVGPLVAADRTAFAGREVFEFVDDVDRRERVVVRQREVVDHADVRRCRCVGLSWCSGGFDHGRLDGAVDRRACVAGLLEPTLEARQAAVDRDLT